MDTQETEVLVAEAVKLQSQKEAVRSFILEIELSTDPAIGSIGSQKKAFLLAKSPEAKVARAAITVKLLAGLKDGTIKLTDRAKTKYDTDAKLKKYCSGLISNWLKKDKEL